MFDRENFYTEVYRSELARHACASASGHGNEEVSCRHHSVHCQRLERGLAVDEGKLEFFQSFKAVL